MDLPNYEHDYDYFLCLYLAKNPIMKHIDKGSTEEVNKYELRLRWRCIYCKEGLDKHATTKATDAIEATAVPPRWANRKCLFGPEYFSGIPEMYSERYNMWLSDLRRMVEEHRERGQFMAFKGTGVPRRIK